MLYTFRFFSSKCSLFHNAKFFGSCIIHILYTGCAEIKKSNSGAKVLNGFVRFAGRRNLVSAHVPSHFNWPQLPGDKAIRA